IHSASYTFTAADVGKTVIVRGAQGITDGSATAPLIATIIGTSGGDAVLSQTYTLAAPTGSFNQMDFGTLNCPAFNAAIAAVPAAGGTVFIPAGNYMLGRPKGATGTFTNTRINIGAGRNDITLRGEGMGATNLYYVSAGPTSSGYLTGTPLTVGLDPEGDIDHVTLQDFSINDLGFYGGSGNGLNCWHTTNLTIKRIRITNAKGNAAFNGQGNRRPSGNLLVVGCEAIGNATGGHISGDAYNFGEFNGVRFIHNFGTGCFRHGYEGGGICYDQFIAFNLFNMGTGGLSAINPTGANRTIVHGNTLVNVGPGYGIDFTTDVGAEFFSRDNRITNNYIQMAVGGNYAGIRLQNTSGDTTQLHVDRFIIANNQIEWTASNGVAKGIYISDFFWPEVIITGNKVNLNHTSATAFYIPNMSDPAPTRWMLIKGNIIKDGWLWASETSVSNAVLKKFIADDNIQMTPQLNFYGGYAQSSFGGASIGAGAVVTSVVGVGGAIAGSDEMPIIRPSGMNTSLITWAASTSTGNITFSQYNPTASPITAVDVKAYIKRVQIGR